MLGSLVLLPGAAPTSTSMLGAAPVAQFSNKIKRTIKQLL